MIESIIEIITQLFIDLGLNKLYIFIKELLQVTLSKIKKIFSTLYNKNGTT
jgi:hypothetical protein